jgi:hypothetical protein
MVFRELCGHPENVINSLPQKKGGRFKSGETLFEATPVNPIDHRPLSGTTRRQHLRTSRPLKHSYQIDPVEASSLIRERLLLHDTILLTLQLTKLNKMAEPSRKRPRVTPRNSEMNEAVDRPEAITPYALVSWHASRINRDVLLTITSSSIN